MSYVFVDPRYTACTQGTAGAYAKCLAKKAPKFLPIEAPGGIAVSKSPDLIQVGEGTGVGPCGEPKSCKTKLDFPTPKEALKLGLPPGTTAVMTKCVVAGKSPLNTMVPVTSLVEALEVSKDFCGCVGKSKASSVRRKCARK